MFKKVSGEFDKETTLRMWRRICESHYFELAFKKFVEETGINVVKTPFYLSTGQEAISAALSTVFPEAVLFTRYRYHDIYLAWGGDPEILADKLINLCEYIEGKEDDGFMKFQKACIVFINDLSSEEICVLKVEELVITKKAPILFVHVNNNLSIQIDVTNVFGVEAFEMTDDPWLIMHTFRNLRSKFPAFFNIYACRDFIEWNRFEMVKEELDRIGLCALAGRVELDATAKMNGIWTRRLREFKKTQEK